MTEPAANLSFLPWVRQGAAATIAAVDTLAPQPAVATLAAVVTINTITPVPVTVRLRGPADVVGIDANQVIRTDPHPGTTDFEPNCFPSVEFDRADFPWLFTPAKADPAGRLRPWLCLVVVREQDGVTLGPVGQGPLPVLQIAAPARPVDELPDLAECWAWVHAQAAAADSSAAQVGSALAGAPQLSQSRLVCPRRLDVNTAYIACVVPTFELGRKAGLGTTIADADATAATALAMAWSMKPVAPTQVTLPVYFQWRFRTGPGGDFASLARALRPQPVPDDLGLRPIDIGTPGFAVAGGIPAATTLQLEGALQPLNATDAPPAWPGGLDAPFEDALAAIVNAPGASALVDPQADPLLAPPLYGRWYAARPTVNRGAAPWFDQLNLDPRYRAIAAFGTLIVQQQQEALMASAWSQAASLAHANRRLRQLQMSLAVGNSLYARHFSRLDADATMRITAPAFGRIRTTATNDPVARTIVARIAMTPVPVQAASVAMRRIGRDRGPLTRRIAAEGITRSTTASWIGILNVGNAVFTAEPAVTLATVSAVAHTLPSTAAITPTIAVNATAVANMKGRPTFQIAAEGQAVAVPAIQALPPGADSLAARAFRVAAGDHLTRVSPGRFIFRPPTRKLLVVTDLHAEVIATLQPRATLTDFTRALVSTAAGASAPVDTAASAAAGIDTVLFAPTFEQPMYESLRDLSQDLLLPGLSNVLADSVLGLKTNRRFIEAFLVGLNVEMGHELLWRGFPTDQRGTCFDQFWDTSGSPVPRPDIAPIHLWGDRKLGDPAGAPAREQFVMLMRSSLLRRYPNAIIYATPALMSNGTRTPSLVPADELQPAFRGEMRPDLSFFGFDITADAATGKGGQAGYYIVIQEHPTEPRFGLAVGTPAGSGTHVGLAAGPPSGVVPGTLQWGRNAAHMAGILRRLPVRIAIHASLFVAS